MFFFGSCWFGFEGVFCVGFVVLGVCYGRSFFGISVYRLFNIEVLRFF